MVTLTFKYYSKNIGNGVGLVYSHLEEDHMDDYEVKVFLKCEYLNDPS